MKIGFLFNHDATHQVPHTIPVAAALGARGAEIVILTSSLEQQELAAALLALTPNLGGDIRFTALTISTAGRVLNRLLRHVAPFKRLAILRANLAIFATFDALVVPETTTTLLRTRFGLQSPRLIYVPHGAGDGAAGFQPATKAFDLVLLAGPKIRDRMRALDLITEDGSAIVGYPKFDLISTARVPRLFANDRPTVLYNPHFNPKLSSWYRLGQDVLDWFAAQDRFNLIFAPHMMLFRRRIHTSLIHRRIAWRPSIPSRFYGNPALLLDTGSSRSVDMTYVAAADIYLGDVSSQIYEFILRQRPAIFLNTHARDWPNDPDYGQWSLGEVIGTLAALPDALERALAHPAAYAERQRAAIAATFSITDQLAADRAADAIVRFLQRADLSSGSTL